MLAPMTTYSSYLNGQIRPDELEYLRARAEGGFDWIITAACCVHPSGWAFNGQWQCSGDEFLPSLKLAADTISQAGSKPVLQIHHGGRQCPSSLCGGPVSASAIPSERDGAETPRELSEDEIEEIIRSFVQAAKLAERAGFSGVEIHGANTYLIQQFVSPHSNRRTDKWGSDRYLFAERIASEVVSAVGQRLTVGYRFSPEEAETPGIRMEHTFQLLDRLAPLGLDYLHISLRKFDQLSMHEVGGSPVLQQCASHLAGRVSMIASGSIRIWTDVEAALDLGAHSVAVGRWAILNPDWVHLARSGGKMRESVPSENASSVLNIPAGLAEKIYSVPGWFPVDAATR